MALSVWKLTVHDETSIIAHGPFRGSKGVSPWTLRDALGSRQVERVLRVNGFQMLAKKVVETAWENLVIVLVLKE